MIDCFDMKDLAQELIRIANKLAAIDNRPGEYEKALREQAKDLEVLRERMDPRYKVLRKRMKEIPLPSLPSGDSEPITYKSGDTYWLTKNRTIHREDGPAVELADGGKEWLVNGKHHRVGGPAIERADGSQVWYRDGEIHREDGPAMDDGMGTRSWWRNGKRHRDGGPAVERNDGFSAWYQNNELHREDGPAVEEPDGTKAWYRGGVLHREDGPAVWRPDGNHEWWNWGRKLP